MESSLDPAPDRVTTLPVKRRVIRTTAVPARLPPLKTQIANAGKALLRAGKAIIKGKPLERTEEQKAACLAICAGCDKWDEQAKRCLECGCFMALKSRLATEQCPLGHWPDFDRPSEACPPPAKA